MTPSNAIATALASETDDVLAEVRAVIHKRVGIDPDRVLPRSTFSDLAIDSLDVVDIMLNLELRFHIAFATEDYKAIDRIADLVAEIRRKLAA